jgi:glycine/D-amino acid oxidase-like deaminating enzyme
VKVSVIIIGQGLCGTWLSYWLQQAGIDFILIDEERPNTSTRVASGVINPVTGRRMSVTWLVDELIPFAVSSYEAMGNMLHTNSVDKASASHHASETSNLKPHTSNLISRCDINDFFNSPDRRIDFEKKATQFAAYLHWPEAEQQYRHHFHYDLGFGIIAPAYQVDLQSMLDGWRALLKKSGRLIEEKFDHQQLQLEKGLVQYKEVLAEKIIFADGIAAGNAGFFQLLPFALNKGEALILKINDLPADHIYKKGNTITPWRGGLFWAGSTYNNHYTDDLPSDLFRQQMEAWLRSFLKHDFEVLDHLAAIRPATVERRPFAGWHPHHRQVGILNGTGTKGCTLAPFFAKQLVDNLQHGAALMAQADLARHSRLLTR